MKKIIQYVSFVIRCNPLSFFASSLLYLCNLLFAAGLLGMASFLISLAALHPTYDAMMIPVVCVRMFGLGRAVLSYSERYCSHNNTFKILKKLRLQLYDRMALQLPDYKTRRAQNLSKIISDVELLQEGILRLIYPLVSSVFLLLVGVGISHLFHPWLAILYGLLFVINYYLYPILMFLVNTKKRDRIDYDKQQLYEELLELKEGMNEITSDGKEQAWLNRIENRLAQMNGNVYEHQSLVALCEALIIFLQGISILLLLVMATYLTWKHELSGVQLAAGILAISSLVTEAMLPSQTYFKFNGIKRAANSVFGGTETMDERGISGTEDSCYENYDEISSGNSVSQDTVLINNISFSYSTVLIKNISFSYPTGRRLFEHFSMELKKGTIVAVVGKSGCGKSTLANLILGFLNPKEGEITIGGVEIHKLKEKERFQLFSVVDQKPFFFHQSIYENLQLADPMASEAQMIEVLERVGLLELINASEQGLHTLVYEWGANLSGGELQRLAIARALLKDAPFYIFDEPTAGLDTINEKIIMDIILALSADHGILLITHRPNLLEKFDSVIRL